MLAHGLTSAGLFFIIGIIYERSYTRNIKYFGGIASQAPILVGICLLTILANTAFPGTFNFIGELLIFCSLINE